MTFKVDLSTLDPAADEFSTENEGGGIADRSSVRAERGLLTEFDPLLEPA